MPWEPNDKEVESVLALPDDQRYRYFVSRTADSETVWALRSADGDWALATDENGTEVMPVWPHERYAAVHTDGPWADYRPHAIALAKWFERWLPGLRRDGHEVAVFPVADGAGVRVTPARLEEDLREALEQY